MRPAELQEVPDARIEQPSDAVVRLTMTAICGTDLHMVRGTMPGMVPGTVPGHESVVVAVGDQVRSFVPGDRVVIGDRPKPWEIDCSCARVVMLYATSSTGPL